MNMHLGMRVIQSESEWRMGWGMWPHPADIFTSPTETECRWREAGSDFLYFISHNAFMCICVFLFVLTVFYRLFLPVRANIPTSPECMGGIRSAPVLGNVVVVLVFVKVECLFHFNNIVIRKVQHAQYCSFVIRVLWQLWRLVARLETLPRLSCLTHSLPLGRHGTFFITVWYWQVAAGDERRMAITCLIVFEGIWVYLLWFGRLVLHSKFVMKRTCESEYKQRFSFFA